MDFVRGGEAGAEARDFDYDRANVFVNRRRLERIAEMVEALRAAPHQLIERRARHILFDWTRQANHQHGVMRDSRGSDDGEPERRDEGRRDCEDRNPRLPVAGSARNRTNGTENRDNNPESNLAAYPQPVTN